MHIKVSAQDSASIYEQRALDSMHNQLFEQT